MSGGAAGADVIWGEQAALNNHEVVHWSFSGHKPHTSNYICELDDSQLRTADPFIELANKSMYRKWPTSSLFVNNLLRRNFYQVFWSDRVYAVASFVNDSSMLQISGGTAWACQLFIDRWLYKSPNVTAIPIYLFDQVSKSWYTWTGQWKPIIKPPAPNGVYAGIGSRNLQDSGKNAIIDVYG